MKIHEYQAKDILRRYGVSVPEGQVAVSFEEADAAAQQLFGAGNGVEAIGCGHGLPFGPAASRLIRGPPTPGDRRRTVPAEATTGLTRCQHFVELAGDQGCCSRFR